MLVGGGLMFVLMHGEVSADSKEVPEKFVCSTLTVTYPGGYSEVYKPIPIYHCTTKNISCGLSNEGRVSCVKR